MSCIYSAIAEMLLFPRSEIVNILDIAWLKWCTVWNKNCQQVRFH